MDESDARPEDQWPDFIPPDFEPATSPTSKGSDADPQPPVTGPVLPPATGPTRPSAPTGPHAAFGSDGPRDWAPPSGRQPRYRGGSDRWFSQPAPASGWRQSSTAAPATQTVVTSALIGICVIVWMLQNLSSQVTDMLMLIPAIAGQEPWRFITSAFAHSPGSLTHIGFNMLTLWLMGRFLEPILGRAKFLAIYLTSALGGGALFVWLGAWNSAVVGASGAIFGLFGAYLVIAWLLKRPLTSVWVLLGLNLVIMVLFPGIAWQAHVGGFLAGAAATGAVALDLTRRRSGRPSLAWPGIVLVNLLIIAVIVLRYTVFA